MTTGHGDDYNSVVGKRYRTAKYCAERNFSRARSTLYRKVA